MKDKDIQISVHVSLVMLTLTGQGRLAVLRKEDKASSTWSLPKTAWRAGRESLGDAARRVLETETGQEDVLLRQMGAHAGNGLTSLSVAYLALLPREDIHVRSLDARIVPIGPGWGTPEDGDVLEMALGQWKKTRPLQGTDIFALLPDPENFLVSELRQVFHAVASITSEPYQADASNFQKFLERKFLAKGIIEKNPEKKQAPGHKAACAYRFCLGTKNVAQEGERYGRMEPEQSHSG